MARGILGLPRLFSKGPLTYSKSIDGTDEIEELLIEVLDERGIEDGDELSQQEFISVLEDLTNKIYPEGGEQIGPISEEDVFRRCMQSRWADVWEDGFTEATTGQTALFEELIIKANGCTGIADAGPAGIRVLRST